MLEKNGNQGDLCWRRFYKKTPKIRKIYQAHGMSFSESCIKILTGLKNLIQILHTEVFF